MIDIHVSDEHGSLRTVVMRYAGPHDVDLADRHDVDPVLQRQLATSQWEPFDDVRVRAQQDAFMDVLRARGVEVLLADDAPGCYAQHYPRDLGFAIDSVFVVARLNSPRRQTEFAGLRRLVESMSRVVYLDAGTIEGGDVMLDEGCVLVGLGEETSTAGVDALRYQLHRAGVDREVIQIEFAHDGVVHLDDHLNIVAPGVALVHLSAFPPERRRWLSQRFDLIPVTDQESRQVQVNVFAIDPHTVVLGASSDRIAEELQARGIQTIPVDYSEVTKIPGAFRCSTLPLVRG